MDGLTRQSQEELRSAFATNLVELQAVDAAVYAANSFQVEYQGKFYLFMPLGVGEGLCQQIRERGVEPVLIDVGEFLAKGGGSIKCMILNLVPTPEQPTGAKAPSFRAQHTYDH